MGLSLEYTWFALMIVFLYSPSIIILLPIKANCSVSTLEFIFISIFLLLTLRPVILCVSEDFDLLLHVLVSA